MKMVRRSGFTLVEMLVAVAVVVVMMTLFAQIFQMATSAMAKQKGMSENDQRVRLVHSLLSTDLNGDTTKTQTRTFLCTIPYAKGEIAPPWDIVTSGPAPAARRLGYLYISENNPNDDTDDVLQLTITASGGMDLLFGRALILGDAAGNQNWSNQPEFDDVIGVQNQSGDSRFAEVAYFLRGGNIYRRVVLLRDPQKYGSFTPTDEPSNDAGASLSFANYTNGTRNFWTDFDYAAYWDNLNNQPQFIGGDNLGIVTAVTMTNPIYRWGFAYTGTAGAGFGMPREYDSTLPANGGPFFFGRFTQAETSDPKFAWPGLFSATNPNPMDAGPNGTTLTVANGKVTNYSAGTRTGEDVLMSNVIAFDIKVWDPAASYGPDGKPGIAFDSLGNPYDDDGINGPNDNGELGTYGSDDGEWRDIGHIGFTPATVQPLPVPQPPFGFYCATNNRNGYFGANRFDTWGPNVDIDGIAGSDNPPYLPIYTGKDQRPGFANVDDNVNGVFDEAAELGWPGTDDFAPLTAIKITIRFYDVTSNQIRDVSSVFTLVPQ